MLFRSINQGSRLSAVRLAGMHAVCDVLGLAPCNEEDLYENLDGLCDHQALIEDRLAAPRLRDKQSGLLLYDVTSSDCEGEKDALAAFGSNRAGKRGKPQIVIGLLCDEEGIPCSITEVHIAGQKPYQAIPAPRNFSAHLLEAAQIRLPCLLPARGIVGATKKQLQKKRKSL